MRGLRSQRVSAEMPWDTMGWRAELASESHPTPNASIVLELFTYWTFTWDVFWQKSSIAYKKKSLKTSGLEVGEKNLGNCSISK